MLLMKTSLNMTRILSANPAPRYGVATLFMGLLLVAGCVRPQPTIVPTKPPEVIVDKPGVEMVTDFEDFTGRTDAVASVELRSRVTGYLNSPVHFKDGADVTEGTLLFQIDPKPYQAEVDRTDASVRLAEAHFSRIKKDYDRTLSLKGSKAISDEELDKSAGDKAEAEASVGVAVAARKLAVQNLDFTKILAPMSGRMSRRYVDPGNLVKSDDTILSLLVVLDPIFVYFDVDDRTLLRTRRLIADGKVKPARDGKTTVSIGLPDEDGYPREGLVNFIDSKIDAGTGTLRIRAEVSNKALLLSPGLFVRVRVPIGEPKRALLVPEEAIGTDQGQKFVYVVDDKDEVVYRTVKLGSAYGQKRVIESGLTETDRVIVSGLQRVRPKVKVTVKTTEKPSPGDKGEKSTAPKTTTPTTPTGRVEAAPAPRVVVGS